MFASPWIAAEPADDDPTAQRALFFQRPYFERRKVRGRWESGWGLGLRQGRWKFFEAKLDRITELYDLEADPGETVNLAKRQPERVKELSKRLRNWRRKRKDGAQLEQVSEEDMAKLRALGYMGGEEDSEED